MHVNPHPKTLTKRHYNANANNAGKCDPLVSLFPPGRDKKVIKKQTKKTNKQTNKKNQKQTRPSTILCKIQILQSNKN